MIGRSDGGFAGGVLGLTDEMRQHGARPIWLGYIGVDDVDATVARIEAKGGKVLMPAFDIPQGRIAMVADPQGNPFYVMKPIPPAGKPDGGKRRLLADAGAARRLERADDRRPGGGAAILRRAVRLDQRRLHADGRVRRVSLLRSCRHDDRRRLRRHAGRQQPAGATTSACRRSPPAVEAVKAGGGQVSMGPHEVPGGDHIIIGNDPQGAEFALVGKA